VVPGLAVSRDGVEGDERFLHDGGEHGLSGALGDRDEAMTGILPVMANSRMVAWGFAGRIACWRRAPHVFDRDRGGPANLAGVAAPARGPASATCNP